MVKNTVFLLFCIFVLFEVKYSSLSLENNIISCKLKIKELQKDYHILKADWKFLTSPTRVQKLNDRYLGLNQTEPLQMKTFDSYSEKMIHVVKKQRKKKS